MDKPIPYRPNATYASVSQYDAWQLLFADPDCGNQWFWGEDYTPEETRQLAIEAWDRYSPAWSVRLMRTVTIAELDEPNRIEALEAAISRKNEALRALEYWFDTDAEIVDAMDPDTRADHERKLELIRKALKD